MRFLRNCPQHKISVIYNLYLTKFDFILNGVYVFWKAIEMSEIHPFNETLTSKFKWLISRKQLGRIRSGFKKSSPFVALYPKNVIRNWTVRSREITKIERNITIFSQPNRQFSTHPFTHKTPRILNHSSHVNHKRL